jgi:hypothetical protein
MKKLLIFSSFMLLACASGGFAQINNGGGGGDGIGRLALLNQTTDAFNRSGAMGANWTSYLNGITVSAGAIQGTTASLENLSAYTGVSSSATQMASATIVTLNGTTDAGGPAVRISGTPTTSVSFYNCTENSTTLTLQKVVGASNAAFGTLTTLASTAITGAVGDWIALSVNGNTLSCARNGLTPILQVNDSTSPLTTGSPGVYEFNNVATLGSFIVTNVGALAGANLNVVFDGDSLISNTAAPADVDPPLSYIYLAKSPAYVTNAAVGAKCLGIGCPAVNSGTVESMLATGTTVIDPLFVPGITNVLVFFGGGNDLDGGGRTPAQVYADLTTYVAARHAAGWKVVVATLVSRKATSSPAVDLKITLYDSLVKANTAGADYVIVHPNWLIGLGASVNTTMFNADQTHLTQFAQTSIMAPAYSAAINRF